MIRILVKPSRHDLFRVIRDAFTTANFRCRERTVNPSTAELEHIVNLIKDTRSGDQSWDGGTVGKSYQQSAETTYARITWMVINRKKYVRIRADRVNCNNNRVGKEKNPILISDYISSLQPFGWLFFNSGFVFPVDASDWLVVADWFDDRGETGTGGFIRELVGSVRVKR